MSKTTEDRIARRLNTNIRLPSSIRRTAARMWRALGHPDPSRIHRTRKRFGLLVCLALFAPPFFSSWFHEVSFLCQMAIGIWTVHHWVLDSSKRRQKHALISLLVFGLVVMTFWIAILFSPMLYTARTFGVEAKFGAIFLNVFLGDEVQAEKAAMEWYATAPALPSILKRKKQVIGYSAVPVEILMSFRVPRAWQEPTWSGPTRMAWVEFPLWTAVALSVGPCGTVCIGRVRRRRREKLKGHCKSCGYDLTGNVSGVCSECGQGRQHANP